MMSGWKDALDPVDSKVPKKSMIPDLPQNVALLLVLLYY